MVPLIVGLSPVHHPCGTRVAAGVGHAPSWWRGSAGCDAGVLGMASCRSGSQGTHTTQQGGALVVQAAIRGYMWVCMSACALVRVCVCDQYRLGLAKEGCLEICKCLLTVYICLALWFICCITLILNVEFTDCLLSTCY